MQHIADKLKPSMQFPADANITIHYVDEDVVNAATTLAGHIFIYKGLLEKLNSENAIAMLIGHEMAHVKYRHPLKGLGKAVIMGILFSMLLGQSSDVSEQVLNKAGGLALLQFSREQERVSDALALSSVQSIYKHINGASDLFSVLIKKTADIPEFLNSHPNTKKRIKYISIMAKKNNWSLHGERVAVPDFIANLSKIKSH